MLMDLHGFNNLGNTCYINSVLQSFIYDPVFNNFLNYKNPFVDSLKSIESFIDFFLKENKLFKRFQQSDAHEFLICFLELLLKNSPTIEKEYFNSPFIKRYYGQTKKTIKCLHCNKVNTVFEYFNTINLYINEPGDITTHFIKYLKKEIHSDPENLYYCESCKCNRITEQKINLEIIPEVLIIVLKRYFGNINILPNKKLFIKNGDVIKKYTLTSTVNHTGNMNYGHYTANVKKDNEWYSIDDTIISKGEINNAYILFYNHLE